MSDDDDTTGPDPALLAAMGFATFGAPAAPPSKKRKLHTDHTVVALAPGPSSGSGANNTPLGARRDAAGEATPGAGGTAGSGAVQGEEGARAKGDGGLAAFLSRGKALAAPEPQLQPVAAEIGSAGEQAGRQGEGEGGRRREKVPLEAYRHGVRDHRGDVAIFMPSFLEDPWIALRS